MNLDAYFPFPTLDLQQRSNAYTIMREFLKAGLPTGVALAAVANSMGESQLGKHPYGDEDKARPGLYHSIGLFQLSDTGAGKGMSVNERLDPTTNTRRIIRELNVLNRSGIPWGKELLNAATAGATVADLIYLFARDIERPRDVTRATSERISWAKKLFGPYLYVPSTSLPGLTAPSPSPPPEAEPSWWQQAQQAWNEFWSTDETPALSASWSLIPSPVPLRIVDVSQVAHAPGPITPGAYQVQAAVSGTWVAAGNFQAEPGHRYSLSTADGKIKLTDSFRRSAE